MIIIIIIIYFAFFNLLFLWLFFFLSLNKGLLQELLLTPILFYFPEP